VSGGLTLPLLLAGVATGAGLLLLAVARPALACALLAVAIPLTAGLGRGTVVPVLRVNEALLLVVTAGVALGRLPRQRQLPFTGLDLAVFAFCAGGVLIPWAVILLSGASADQQEWVQVLGPVQYLVVYLLFSRTELSGSALRRLLNALMLASVPVAIVAVAQAADVAGVRDLVGAYYPTQPLPSWDTVYRPASLLGYYSAVGAFGLLNFLLALALSASRHPGFSRLWLTVVMGVNFVGLLASATLAPLLALPVGVVAVLLVARRVPWDQAARALPVLAVSGVALWPLLTARLQQQLGGGGLDLHLPETLATRLTYWQELFVPALLAHGPWLGTGTIIPSEVPRPLVDFVDNGYLWQWFRAGVPGVALYVLLLAAVGASAWSTRSRPDLDRRAVGATCLGAVASIVLVDVTSEYLTFTAVSQEFWMLAGLLAGLTLRARAGPAPFVEVGAVARPAVLPVRIAGAAARRSAPWVGALRRLAPESAFLRSSLAVLVGFGLARLLGFAFQVTAGRLLAPPDYGRLTYALAVAAVLSVLLTTAPLGLSRFLARHAGDRSEQGAWYGAWLVAVGVVLGVSVAVTVVAAPRLGLGGWLLAGLLANLLGVAALETYREVQRGLGRYSMQSAFYVLANALQLAAVLALSALGGATPALFLLAYGLSGAGALAVFAPLSRGGPALNARTLPWARVWEVVRFLRPVLLQAVLWNVWFVGDLILVERLRGPADTGTYGAAKAIANGFLIVPAAISFVLAPRVARLSRAEVPGQLARAIGLTAAVVVPLAAVTVAAARPLTLAFFGGRYAAAAGPLAVLAVGMALYGLKSVLGALWLGLGRPVVDTVATGAATAVTLAAGVLLIPGAGPLGAAVAFTAGAAAQLAVAGGVTASAFARRRRAVPGPAPVLLVAEELDPVPDEAYAKFVHEVGAALEGRRPLVRRSTRAGPWDRLAAARVASRALQLALARAPGRRPAAVIYASRSSVTAMALLRGRLLGLLRRAPVALVALQEFRVRSRRVLRWLAPDLLLVPTGADCARARRAGVNAALVQSGVDLDRFRPALPGERAALRRRWSLAAEATVVLHVGHLRDGRNLERPLASLAAAGATVVLVASGRRGPESVRLRDALRAAGVRVLEGYQPRIEELYRLADCYVFTTESRGDAAALPLSVLEALASDVPVACPRFGALAERFEGAAGVSVVERPEELTAAALALAGGGARTRPLAEPFGWAAVTERLLAQLDDAALLDRAERAGRPAALRARWRRAVTVLRGQPRLRLWGRRFAYEVRPHEGVAIEPARGVRSPRRPAAPGAGEVALLDCRPESVFAAAARLSGVRAEAARGRVPDALIDRALTERWPLVHGRPSDLDRLSESAWGALSAFVHLGGTLYVDAAGASGGRLGPVSEHLGLAPPGVRAAEAGSVTFAAEHADFARELAGARLEAPVRWPALLPAAGSEVLVRAGGGEPLVLRHRVGQGAVVLSTGPAEVRRRLADALVAGSPLAAAAAIPLVLLRSLYGSSAWHAPAILANFSIDDPALRRGRLGLRWDLLLGQARDGGFHTTIATVPRELPLAEAPVAELFRRHPDLLSACYHGCDHDGYEFYAPDARRTRYAARPLAVQRQGLGQAVEYGRSFTAALGAELDRVMVFPYGPGPAAILPDLHRLGFVASANFGDKDPPGSARPVDEDLGLRPADLAWSGFPLLWRRGLRDRSAAIDVLLGRPLLVFAHGRALGVDFAPFAERAAAIGRLTGGTARWCSLDEVARHAYLQRRMADGGWQVLMTTNEACLHNPDPEPRVYAVLRPHRPPDTTFDVEDVLGSGEPLVTVPPGGTSVIRLVARGALRPLAGRRRCSVFP
jgi:O-antigen/teichoic acid export membrane protein/glycosyltransferase involved in cell wall biosynthesis